jgi:hypothetical protein
MAREEHDREDLLREATAMVERASLRVGFFAEPVFVGFRRDGAVSFYFGGDPVYQFNAAGELRRAFCDGALYKAVRGELVEMHRERTDAETRLVSRSLSQAESIALRSRMTELLRALLAAIQPQSGAASSTGTGAFELLGEVPEGGQVAGRAAAWLTVHLTAIKGAASPRVTG